MHTVTLVADPYPPYQYEEDGTVKGIDQDIISAALAHQNIQVNTRLFPWETCLRKMQTGAADGIFQITLTAARKKELLFSEPFRTAKTLFFKHTQARIAFDPEKDLATQLKGHRLGVLTGYSYDPFIDQLRSPVKTEIDTQEILLEVLLTGELDLILMDHGVAVYLIEKLQLENLEQVRGYEITRQLHVAFQPIRHELAHHFNIGLDKIKAKGLYHRTLSKYGLGDSLA